VSIAHRGIAALRLSRGPMRRFAGTKKRVSKLSQS
jgi:hypothetical protein